MSVIEKAVKKFKRDGTLINLSDEELHSFPKWFLVTFAKKHIDAIYQRFPVELRKDRDIAGYQRCYKHAIFYESDDEFDGPPSYKCNCTDCAAEDREM